MKEIQYQNNSIGLNHNISRRDWNEGILASFDELRDYCSTKEMIKCGAPSFDFRIEDEKRENRQPIIDAYKKYYILPIIKAAKDLTHTHAAEFDIVFALNCRMLVEDYILDILWDEGATILKYNIFEVTEHNRRHRLGFNNFEYVYYIQFNKDNNGIKL